MKVRATLLLGTLCIILSLCKTTLGLTCHKCTYMEMGGTTFGDPKCQSGISQPEEKCEEGHAGNHKLACMQNQMDAEVDGKRVKMTLRSCGTASPDEQPGCRKGAKADLKNLRNLPDKVAPLSGDTEMQECICFKDKCNSANTNTSGMMMMSAVFSTGLIIANLSIFVA